MGCAHSIAARFHGMWVVFSLGPKRVSLDQAWLANDTCPPALDWWQSATGVFCVFSQSALYGVSLRFVCSLAEVTTSFCLLATLGNTLITTCQATMADKRPYHFLLSLSLIGFDAEQPTLDGGLCTDAPMSSGTSRNQTPTEQRSRAVSGRV